MFSCPVFVFVFVFVHSGAWQPGSSPGSGHTCSSSQLTVFMRQLHLSTRSFPPLQSGTTISETECSRVLDGFAQVWFPISQVATFPVKVFLVLVLGHSAVEPIPTKSLGFWVFMIAVFPQMLIVQKTRSRISPGLPERWRKDDWVFHLNGNTISYILYKSRLLFYIFRQ